MAKYRKKPVVIEAWHYTGDGFQAKAPAWVLDYRSADGQQIRLQQNSTLTVPTLEGDHTALMGDWIIQGIKGELYPCKPDIFEATYEAVER